MKFYAKLSVTGELPCECLGLGKDFFCVHPMDFRVIGT